MDLVEKEIDLKNQQICTNCDHNQLGEFKWKECDDILCQMTQGTFQLKVTGTHVVTKIQVCCS